MPRPDSARTAGGRDVRAVQPNRDAVPARATAFGTAPAPRAPRAQADAHPHRTLATRAEPKPPPPCRPQSATGAPCGARPHPSSPAQPPPLRRRVRPWRLTTLATRAYRQQQTHALRSLLVEGQHNEALAAPAVDTLASAPRYPAAIATWSSRPPVVALTQTSHTRAPGGAISTRRLQAGAPRGSGIHSPGTRFRSAAGRERLGAPARDARWGRLSVLSLGACRRRLTAARRYRWIAGGRFGTRRRLARRRGGGARRHEASMRARTGGHGRSAPVGRRPSPSGRRGSASRSSVRSPRWRRATCGREAASAPRP